LLQLSTILSSNVPFKQGTINRTLLQTNILNSTEKNNYLTKKNLDEVTVLLEC